MTQQITIPVSNRREFTFANFIQSDNAALVVALVEVSIGLQPIPVLFFWGETGSGKTHLLHACCDTASEQRRRFHYFSLSNDCADVIQATEVSEAGLVCIDNLELLSQDNRDLSLALLSLYEKVMQAGGNIIVTANHPLVNLEMPLPDLVSRLSAGGTYHLAPLGDEDKYTALMARAEQRGFSLSEAVVEFIMHHYERDTRALFALLDRIDRSSLAEKRKITLPFVRELVKTASLQWST